MDRGRRAREALRALRPHQWLKNLLVLCPLIAAHKVADQRLLVSALVALVAFSLCASGGYLVNDLLDLRADRRHPHKRARPFAAGTLPTAWAAFLVPGTLLAAVGLSLLLSPVFTALLAGYLAVSLAYSWRLKGILLVDVLVLAGLYTVRLHAGAVAVQVELSFWLSALSMFLFLSLAMVKRYSELLELRGMGDEEARGRSYRSLDLDALMSLGAASGYLSVLVLALYIHSEDVSRLYARPAVIWLLCPLLLYWVSRIWLLARRGELRHDPLVFACRDPASWVVAGLGTAVFLLAI
jgi:4-hydroxybenzoate polyprenyltransferase